ncbi:MAG: tetratricopeptide repeat protein [Velocimicrobium sp.]
MICPVCEKETSFQNLTCSNCGQDLAIYKRAIGISNMYYNVGLEKARVRDLSGAVNFLQKSLRFDKKNTEARNLLGLIYYEMGEVVEALSEWVLSKNFQNEDNSADYYMNAIQKNASSLESINQTIKKYNSALSYAKQGSEDLAVMQLEKVISLNPKFIRSYQLLSVLYMKIGDNKKAAKCLSKANKIDRNNTLTLKYMSELPGTFVNSNEKIKGENSNVLSEQDMSLKAFSQGSYREEKFNFWPYLNLLIGAILGIAVVYYLIVPTAKKSIASQYEEQFKTYSDQMASQSATTTQLTAENEELKTKAKELQTKLATLQEEGVDEDSMNYYFKAIQYYMQDDKEKAADMLSNVKEAAIENSKAKQIYNLIKEDTFSKAAEVMAEEGRVTYNSGKYEKAIETLQKAIVMQPENVKAMYFLGRSYHRLGKYDKAREYYEMIINNYPDSDRVADATRRIAEIENQ